MRAHCLATFLLASLLAPALAHAQTWSPDHGVYGAAITTSATSDEAIAREVLGMRGAELGLEPGATLQVVRTTPSHGYAVVELARVVRGLVVVNAPIVVRLRPDRAVDLIEVAPMPALASPWPALPSLTDANLVATAAAPFASASAIDSWPVALVHEGAVIAAVRVELRGPRPIDRARAYVEQSTLTLVWLEELGLDALGRVYPKNPASDMMMTMDLPLADLTSTTNLDGTHLRVESCDQLTADCNTVAHASPDVDGNYLFAPMRQAFDDAFSEVSAYYHGGRVVDYFHTAHNFTWTCMGGVRMDVIVNYSMTPHVGYENAMFEPGSRNQCGTLVFGQGTNNDYAYDGDVVYHEYGHAVTDQISTLGFFATGPSDNYQPLAINEGTSDYWAAAVQGDPQIGESIGSVEGFMGSLRGIDDVVVCPDTLIGEGHSDGRIWSTFGWAIRGIVGQTRADAVWFTTMSTLAGGVTLAQATSTVLATVASEVSMGHITAEEQTAIMAAATARGLPDCTMFVPLDDGLNRNGYSGNQFVTGGLSHGLAPIQYTVQVPPDVTDVEVDIGHGSLTGLTNIHFSTGTPVRATGSRVTSQRSVPVGRIGTATFSRAQGLMPCTTLYIGVETTDLRAGESLYQILTRVNTTHETRACPPPQHDAGPADAGSDAASLDAGVSDGSVTPPASGGCGCGVGASRNGLGWLVFALALAILGRRRGRAT